MRPWVPAVVLPLGVAVLSLVLAGFARYRLVEPADLTATCDAVPWQGAVCVLRSLTVQAFAAQRLGGVALALGLLALLTRWRVAALLALAGGGAGLVLYSTTLAAPAVLLAGFALVRRRTGVGSGAGAAR
jgi:hypothetical protein